MLLDRDVLQAHTKGPVCRIGAGYRHRQRLDRRARASVGAGVVRALRVEIDDGDGFARRPTAGLYAIGIARIIIQLDAQVSVASSTSSIGFYRNAVGNRHCADCGSTVVGLTEIETKRDGRIGRSIGRHIARGTDGRRGTKHWGAICGGAGWSDARRRVGQGTVPRVRVAVQRACCDVARVDRQAARLDWNGHSASGHSRTARINRATGGTRSPAAVS